MVLLLLFWLLESVAFLLLFPLLFCFYLSWYRTLILTNNNN
jgi:hypothetical protein